MRVFFDLMPYTNLGNWMFQYAVAKSIGGDVACFTGVLGAIERLKRYDWFSDVEVVDQLPADCYNLVEAGNIRYAPLEIPADERNVLLSGYFQSEKYFDKDKVRRIFAFDEKTLEIVRSSYALELSRPNVTAISVRRGDYMRSLHAHPFVGKQFFRDCIVRMPEVKDFIVCSDDIDWCRRFFSKEFPNRHFTYSRRVTPMDDLIIPALCKNNIISNSSYSWWGAWLNPNPKKRVLAPSLWFGYHYANKGWNWRDVYFDGVEVINNDYDFVRWCQGHLCEYWLRFKAFALPAYRIVCRLMPFIRKSNGALSK